MCGLCFPMTHTQKGLNFIIKKKQYSVMVTSSTPGWKYKTSQCKNEMVPKKRETLNKII